MKRSISILFLAVIVFQSLSGFFVLASFYLNRTYISQNLCVNRFDAVQVCKGKCYLAKELKKDEQQQQKFPDLKQKEVNLYCEETSLNANASNRQLVLGLVLVSEDNHYSGNHQPSIFHPPPVA